MQFFSILQLAAIASFVNAAPVDPRAAEPFDTSNHLVALERPVADNGVVPAVTVASRVSKRPVRTSTTTTHVAPTTTPTTTSKATTTSKSTTTTTASSGIFTSVNQALCSNAYPTGKPDFTQIPTSCGQSWIDILGMWRRAYGLQGYTWSPHLAEVAYGAAYNASGGAKQFTHSNLQYWNSSAEVESPGFVAPYDSNVNLLGMTPFSNAIANWLCEVPSDPQLKSTGFTGIDLCTAVVKNIDYIGESAGETGHHDIMLSGYTQIGCAFVWNTQQPSGPFAGIYVCDFK